MGGGRLEGSWEERAAGRPFGRRCWRAVVKQLEDSWKALSGTVPHCPPLARVGGS